MPSLKVVVVGQGYVGLPLSMRCVEVGHDVVGIDVDVTRVEALRSGRSFVEDIPDEVLRSASATGRYLATTAYDAANGFDVCVVTVPTPLHEGLPDLRHIEDAGRAIAPHIRAGCTVVLESTTYPGTTQELLGPILEAGSSLKPEVDFSLAYSPERIDPGNVEWTLVNTPKVVAGVGPVSQAAACSFYGQLVDTVVPVDGASTAELTKLLENTFRHVNIALVNELAMFAHDLGIDIWGAVDAASTKPFGFMRFTPGPGVGGHCLPIDPSYLSWAVKRQLGHNFRFVELANDVNDHMPDYVVQRITASLNDASLPVRGSRVLILGLAYKKNTGDIRESPGLRIIDRLTRLGADVRVADPNVAQSRVPPTATLTTLDAEEVASADLVVLVVDHDGFDLDLLAGARVLDTRHVLPRTTAVEHL